MSGSDAWQSKDGGEDRNGATVIGLGDSSGLLSVLHDACGLPPVHDTCEFPADVGTELPRAADPYADPFADTLTAEEGPRSERPAWCVDAGNEVLTMSTFELWAAIDSGEVAPAMRVWCEGMECWTPASDLPEFTDVIAKTVPSPPVAPTDQPLVRRPNARGSNGGSPWIGVGTAVAVAAIGLTFLPSSHRHVEPHVMTVSPLPLAAAAADVAVSSVPLSTLDTTAEISSRHEERGQRRMPRNGRGSYGR